MSSKLTALLLSPALLMGCQTDDLAPTFEDTEAYLDREVLVSVQDNGDGVAMMQVEKAFGLATISNLEPIGVTRLLIEGEEEAMAVKDMIRELEGDHRVAFAAVGALVDELAIFLLAIPGIEVVAVLDPRRGCRSFRLGLGGPGDSLTTS